MSSLDKTVSWCSVRSCPPSPPSVNTSEITFDSEYAEVGNGSNKTCTAHGYPFCVNVLTKTINDSKYVLPWQRSSSNKIWCRSTLCLVLSIYNTLSAYFAP